MKTDGDIVNLLKKISEITNSIESIPKNGNNSEYDYVLEKDVVDKIRGKLVEKNLVLIPSVVESADRQVILDSGKSTTIVKVTMSFTFFDLENGSSLTTYYQGEGEDTLDKGIYKAITGCQKYSLLKTFLIGTGDDPEKIQKQSVEESTQQKSEKDIEKRPGNTSSNLEEVIPANIAKQLFAIRKGNKQEIEIILSKYGYKTTYDIKKRHLDAIERELKALG